MFKNKRLSDHTTPSMKINQILKRHNITMELYDEPIQSPTKRQKNDDASD